ncbi:9123_t:CDS:2, partial [Ambispora gerdemannii]
MTRSSRQKRSVKRRVSKESIMSSGSYAESQTTSEYTADSMDKRVDSIQQHYNFIQHIWQSCFSAPVEEALMRGSFVLDIGCGTGNWLKEMANEYKCSEFVGVDILRHLTAEVNQLTNITFVQSNVLELLPFEENHFDYVRISNMILCFPENEWGNLLNEVARILKPGGYVEIEEPDLEISNRGPILDHMVSCCLEIYTQHGINSKLHTRLELYLASTNQFTDVEWDHKIFSFSSFNDIPGLSLGEVSYYFVGDIAPRIAEYMGVTEKELIFMFDQIQ